VNLSGNSTVKIAEAIEMPMPCMDISISSCFRGLSLSLYISDVILRTFLRSFFNPSRICLFDAFRFQIMIAKKCSALR
jgi:hypothetical protein